MGYEWIGAAIAGAGSAIAGFAGQHPSKSRRYAKEMARFNTELAEEMYNKYQSPSAQMEQYKAAGLNPNLVYSQNTGGPAAGAADYDSDSMLPNEGKAVQGIANGISTYQSIVGQQIQNQNANLVGDLTRAQVASQELSNIEKESVLPYQIESKALAVQDMTFKVLYKNGAEYRKTLAQIDTEIEKKKNLISKTKLSDEQLKKVQEEITNLQKSRDVMQSRIDLNNAQIKDMNETRPFRIGLYQAQEASGYANAGLANIKTEYYPEEFYNDIINDTNQADGLLGFGKVLQSYMRSRDHKSRAAIRTVLVNWHDQLKAAGMTKQADAIKKMAKKNGIRL